jgi:hypothetical protein
LSTKYVSQPFAALVFLSIFSSPSTAQQTPPSTNPSPPTAQTEAQTAPGSQAEKEKQIEGKERSQHALGALPQFGIVNGRTAPPLTSGGKFHLFVRSTFDPGTLGIVGIEAGISQASNSFPAYGQGWEGYGKRYGAALADNVSSGFFSTYFFPVLLKQDPRYFRLGEGSFGHRFFYGVKQEFVCHTDKGGRAFSWSNVLGAFTAGAISNLYYPGRTLISTTPATATTPAIPHYENDRGVSLTLSRSAIALGYGTAGGLVGEFWPDIHNKLTHKHKQDPARERAAP